MLHEYCAAAASGRQVTASPIKKAVRISFATMFSLGDPVPIPCIGRAIRRLESEVHISWGKGPPRPVWPEPGCPRMGTDKRR